MKLFKKILSATLSTTMIVSLCACGSSTTSSSTTDSSTSTSTTTTSTSSTEATASTEDTTTDLLSDYSQDNESLTFNNSTWNYDEENDVYWQISVGYCTAPETTDYETMGIYVPGKYMTSTANVDGTYTCTINTEGKVSNYTAATAPIIFPVNTAGYSAQAAPTAYSYDGLSSYLDAGYIYVYAGMRGRDNGYDSSNNLTYSGGAPWGVTDLKAAIRYYRYNASILPGNTDSIFTFGMSGGGAQSSLAGATGDSELYFDYLTSIGAAMKDESGNYISDAVTGAMCWCPITSLDYADEAYEWNMGQYATTDTRADSTWTSAISDDLADAYATYLNELGLKDENGTVLTLEQSDTGIHASGSYYNYLISEIEGSLNNFLSDTTFPYTPSNDFKADGGFGGGDAGGTMPSGEKPSGDMPSGGSVPSGDASQSSETTTTTYETVQDYIDSLNTDEEWIQYDAASNTATITSMEAFVNNCKSATKAVGAFDTIDLSSAENNLFGNDESDSLHFDAIMANLLTTNEAKYSAYSDWDSSLVAAYNYALEAVDKFGNSSEYRQNMYNPMYYLDDYYEGYGTSTVATYWRIRTGIDQGDTALTVETNLALALEQNEDVENVDFETVWGLGHTTAERTGDSTTNFIEWVNECLNQ